MQTLYKVLRKNATVSGTQMCGCQTDDQAAATTVLKKHKVLPQISLTWLRNISLRTLCAVPSVSACQRVFPTLSLLLVSECTLTQGVRCGKDGSRVGYAGFLCSSQSSVLHCCVKDVGDRHTGVGVAGFTQLMQRFLLPWKSDWFPRLWWHLRTKPDILNWTHLKKGGKLHT